MQPRETDCVGRAWCGRGLRDRHPSTTRPTARSLPLGARAPGRQGGASTPSRSHSPRTSSARLVDRTATGATRPSPSAESHRVTSPRWTKACSYADPFPTRYFVLYFGWTCDLMSRSCTRSGHRGQRADSCLVAAEGLCTNACAGKARSRGTRCRDVIFETLFETLWVSNPIRPRSAASRNRVMRGPGVTQGAKRSQGARRPRD